MADQPDHMTSIAPPDEARSSLVGESLQEILDASSSARNAVDKGLAQYQTPPEWAEFFASLLPRGANIIFDPQCAAGNLVLSVAKYRHHFGFELDNRFKHDTNVHRVIGNCVKAWELLDELYPDIRFDCQVANPPFGIRWKLPNGGSADSVEYTWKKIIQRAPEKGFGYFIAGRNTIEKFGIHKHEWAYLYTTFPVGVFPKAKVEIGVVFWANLPAMDRPTFKEAHYETLDRNECFAITEPIKQWWQSQSRSLTYNSPSDIRCALNNIQAILNEEKRDVPPFNIWLDPKTGVLRTHLSTRQQLKLQRRNHA